MHQVYTKCYPSFGGIPCSVWIPPWWLGLVAIACGVEALSLCESVKGSSELTQSELGQPGGWKNVKPGGTWMCIPTWLVVTSHGF